MSTQKRYPEELRERSVRLVFESGRPIAQVAKDLGIGSESLRAWVRQAEADGGERSARDAEDERLLALIRTVHGENYEAYGYRRMWKEFARRGERVPRCHGPGPRPRCRSAPAFAESAGSRRRPACARARRLRARRARRSARRSRGAPRARRQRCAPAGG